MKHRVLILAHDFPPMASVGGLRPYAWFKYLNQFGIYPIVITRDWNIIYGDFRDFAVESPNNEPVVETTDEGEIIRVPYKSSLSNKLLLKKGENRFRALRKVLTGASEYSQYVLPVGTKRSLYSLAREYLSRNKVDWILATGEPYVFFTYASKLSDEFEVPWLADYRDPWTQCKEINTNGVFQILNNRYEKDAISNCTHVLTVSDYFKRIISQSVKNTPISVVPNGFDEVIIEKNLGALEQHRRTLRIVYAGTIQAWQPFRQFLWSFAQINDIDVTLTIYGTPNEAHWKGIVQKEFPELVTRVTFKKALPYKRLINTLNQFDLLLLFNGGYWVGTKIYDYLQVGRKMLLCFTDDVDAQKLKNAEFNFDESGLNDLETQQEIVKITNSGISVRDKRELIDIIKCTYAEKLEKGEIICNSINIEKYARREGTKQLAEILLNID